MCPEMINFLVDQTVARLVHIALMHEDRELDPTMEMYDARTLDRAHDRLITMSGTLPAVLQVIMTEGRAGERNASN
jgi:hypothetical protein